MRIIGAEMRCEIKLQTDGYDDSTNDDDYHIWPGLCPYGIPIIMVKSVRRVGATGEDHIATCSDIKSWNSFGQG